MFHRIFVYLVYMSQCFRGFGFIISVMIDKKTKFQEEMLADDNEWLYK